MPKVEIRRNADGIIRSYIDRNPWQDIHEYEWSEGNDSCDCTRGEYFAAAAGEEDPDHPCGDGMYSVRITDGDTVLYQDDNWEA